MILQEHIKKDLSPNTLINNVLTYLRIQVNESIYEEEECID